MTTIESKIYKNMIEEIEKDILDNGHITEVFDYEELIPTTKIELCNFENSLMEHGYYGGDILKFSIMLEAIEKLQDNYKGFGDSEEYIDLIDYYKKDFFEMLEIIITDNGK